MVNICILILFSLLVISCKEGGYSETRHPDRAEKGIQFETEKFLAVTAKLKPTVSYHTGEPTTERPWIDTQAFREWLESLGLDAATISSIEGIVPKVSLYSNHGSIYGVKRFMSENSEAAHEVFETGFLIFGGGANGDYIVVDTSTGMAGWLPMAMVAGMTGEEVREHFVATHRSLGEFYHQSETEVCV